MMNTQNYLQNLFASFSSLFWFSGAHLDSFAKLELKRQKVETKNKAIYKNKKLDTPTVKGRKYDFFVIWVN